MFKNYLKIAWRSLKKQAFFTFLNTFGLAIGMAGALIISLYIYDELSYDKMFADADRIYRIDTDIKFGGAETKSGESAPPMAETLKRDYAQVEASVRFRTIGSSYVKKVGGDKSAKEDRITYADSTFFEFFGIELLAGNPKTALTGTNSLVLTKSAAEKHFGTTDVIGQNLLLDNTDTYTVTGVVDDMPKNSYFNEYSVFLAMAGNEASREELWGSNNYFTFIKLIPGATAEDFQEPLQGILERYMLPWAQKYFPGMTAESFAASGNYIRYHTLPLTDIHLYSDRVNEMNATSSIQNIYILSFIGLFLIILASVNFMNLSTAHSLKRAKEVGVRKTLGSNKMNLVFQFLTESGLIAFVSLIAALIITLIALPFFNSFTGKSIAIPFAQPIFWLILLAATLVLGLFSGSYPAFFMSRFTPVKTLKGSSAESVGNGRVRNALVIFQFSISVFLIVSTLVVFQQLNYIQSKDLGFTKDQVVLINEMGALGSKTKAFKEQITDMANVESATLSNYYPTPSWRSDTSYFQEGARDQESAIQMQEWAVDTDYLKTMEMELVAGRNFNPQYASDSTAILINEATLPILNMSAEEALGVRISEEIDLENPRYYTIIGVIKDFHYSSLRNNIRALGMSLNSDAENMAVRISGGDYANTIAAIESRWNAMAPGQPLDYRFMDEAFNTTYEAEQKLSQIFFIFTMLSIFIACLGLFGLAAFNAEKRTKEIGVRKVLGATVSQISYRLTVDFLKLVGVAILVSLPLGWYAMDKWLEDFSYRIEIGIGIFALAAVLAIVVAIVTVSYQSIKAAVVNPVKSLRSE
ncbi:ABC transporter permease [Maribacter hydrothermalis]|uniref:Cell division protein FtsX n=1 Tax=Maribacter hydrothermalis TaxID=1836467 RepID=A0A1B7Z3E8_9FLAO|nr:ABC transporter permease [Maribacter hydrothermalis]APQ16984.1 cell division protein FtsX [Maribacter hydrothermalis]OBR37245.1 cell division protein FtsX [Maribacter hydrothermalis]